MPASKYPMIAARALKASKAKRLTRLVPILISILASSIAIMFLTSYMYTRFGSFSVTVGKEDQINYGFVLSEDRYFSKPTAYLNCKASESITNIDGKTLDEVDLGVNDGVDNGENYICYTFYLKNTGEKYIDYNEQIVITNMTLGIEKAVRIRVIKTLDGELSQTVDYARAAGVDEYGKAIPEVNTTVFYSKNTVMNNDVVNFAPDSIMKYTIVIWLEGPDSDCVDEILGGEFKIDMVFNVIGISIEKQD